jgi:zinc transporter ZupT
VHRARRARCFFAALTKTKNKPVAMTLLYIVLTTTAGGVLSVLIAAGLTVQVLSRLVKHLVSVSAGVLLGTALLQVLPEAFESGAEPHALFLTRATATGTTTTTTRSRPAAAAGPCWWATACTTSATA